VETGAHKRLLAPRVWRYRPRAEDDDPAQLLLPLFKED
jgi:hypothetical protein